MKLSNIKQNPNNPRLIKDDKFKKLEIPDNLVTLADDCMKDQNGCCCNCIHRFEIVTNYPEKNYGFGCGAPHNFSSKKMYEDYKQKIILNESDGHGYCEMYDSISSCKSHTAYWIHESYQSTDSEIKQHPY